MILFQCYHFPLGSVQPMADILMPVLEAVALALICALVSVIILTCCTLPLEFAELIVPKGNALADGAMFVKFGFVT